MKVLSLSQLASIAESPPRAVTTLNLSNQKFDAIADMSDFKALTRLDLTGNKLASLECVEMSWLNVRSNQISQMHDLSKLGKLKVLNVSSNIFRTLESFRYFRQLKVLVINNNQISEIDHVFNMPELNTLILSHNQLKEIKGLGALTKLEKLALAHNEIRVIPPLTSLYSLYELRLNDNRVTSIPDAARFPHHLNLLDLGKNRISSLIDVQRLSDLPVLRNLTLAGNPVAGVEEYKAYTLRACPNLITLDSKRVVPKKGKVEALQRAGGGDQEAAALKPEFKRDATAASNAGGVVGKRTRSEEKVTEASEQSVKKPRAEAVIAVTTTTSGPKIKSAATEGSKVNASKRGEGAWVKGGDANPFEKAATRKLQSKGADGGDGGDGDGLEADERGSMAEVYEKDPGGGVKSASGVVAMSAKQKKRRGVKRVDIVKASATMEVGLGGASAWE